MWNSQTLFSSGCRNHFPLPPQLFPGVTSWGGEGDKQKESGFDFKPLLHSQDKLLLFRFLPQTSSQKSLATHAAIQSLISRRMGGPVPKLLGERGRYRICCLLAIGCVRQGSESFFSESKTEVRWGRCQNASSLIRPPAHLLTPPKTHAAWGHLKPSNAHSPLLAHQQTGKVTFEANRHQGQVASLPG